MMQQAAEVSELQAEAVRVARELDTQQLLALLTQQQLAAQQEQVGVVLNGMHDPFCSICARGGGV
jgi:hypothetical protein